MPGWPLTSQAVKFGLGESQRDLTLLWPGSAGLGYGVRKS